MNYSHRRIDPKGFTLVELLVVIAIIGALIGLLLPALAAVKEAMNRTKCLNNTRSLAIALNTYEQAHKTFPPGLPSCMTDPTDGAVVKNLGTQAGAVCQGPN